MSMTCSSKARETQNIWMTKERPSTHSKKYKMKLNLAKFAFRVWSGKFLGFMVSQRGIEVNPEKVKAIMDMTSPKTVKKSKD